MINFYQSYGIEHSTNYILDALRSNDLSGDRTYTSLCSEYIENQINVKGVLMTTSCTHALELAIRLINLSDNDEVIMPSYSYPSTANAVILAGGKVVFSQVTKEHLLLDPDYIEEKITENTKAIILVHYGGNCCDMDRIMKMANHHNLYVIEDAAQAYLSKYNNKYAGTIGHIGCFSFHQTKNITSGEGGAIVINDDSLIKRAKIIRQKGTNQEDFYKGKINQYEWVDIGSSYSPSDLLMALLYGQLQLSNIILEKQQKIFKSYVEFFKENLFSQLETFSDKAKSTSVNGHVFYILFKSKVISDAYRRFMKENDIKVYTHFVPLHISLMGKRIKLKGDFSFEDDLGERLIRLPIYPGLSPKELEYIMTCTYKFMNGKC